MSKYQIINTWNGGKKGRVVEFTSEEEDVEGRNECFIWILGHTPFSFHEATTNQGYEVIPEGAAHGNEQPAIRT